MIAIAPTDAGWLNYLRAHSEVDVLNFWTPTPWNFRSLSMGDRFYFLQKGKEPRHIVGWGHYVRYENLRVSVAWDRYGSGNGVASKAELIAKVTGFAEARAASFSRSADPEIGCIILQQPTFLSRADHFTPAEVGLSFPPQVVKFKTFAGTALLRRPKEHRDGRSDESHAEDPAATSIADQLMELAELDGTRLASVRLEQSVLRRALLKGQSTGTCALCGEEFPVSLLVAGHIKRRASCTADEKRDVHNVMPVCKFGCDDLFEQGFVVVTADGRIDAGSTSASTPAVKRKVSFLVGKKCAAWRAQNEAYFQARRQKTAQLAEVSGGF